MSSALALQSFGFDEIELPAAVPQRGAQTLLVLPSPKPSYWVQGTAVAIYLLAVSGLAFYSARPAQLADEDAVELVMLPPPAIPEEAPPPPPPVAEEPPPPPPPPLAEEPAVAPVEPPPPAPKPQPKPKPKVVEHKPIPAQVAAPSTVPANAVASFYANQVHARIAAAARALVSRPGHPTGRVGYHIVISPAGTLISQSITSSSGNPALDAAALQILPRSYGVSGLTVNSALNGSIVVQ